MNFLPEWREGFVDHRDDVLLPRLCEYAFQSGEAITSLLGLYLRLSSEFADDDVFHQLTHLSGVGLEFLRHQGDRKPLGFTEPLAAVPCDPLGDRRGDVSRTSVT